MNSLPHDPTVPITRGTSARLRWASLLLTLALSLASRPAVSAPSATDRETARTLLVEGDWLTERRQYDRALEAYQAAHAIMELPSTGLAVAKTLEALGRLVEARDVVMSIARIAVQPDESEPIAQSRAEARRLAVDLEARIPTVRIRTSSGKPPARVDLNGREVPQQVVNLPYKLDPGDHVARIRWSDGREARQAFSLRAGQHEVVVFDEPAPKPPTPAPREETPIGPAASTRSPTGSSEWSTLTYVGFSTAAVAVTAGAITGVLAWSQASNLERDCPGLKCTCADESCRSARQDDIDRISTLTTLSNVAFGIGLVGAGIGTYGLLSSGNGEARDSAAGTRVDAFAGWGRVGVEGAF